MATTKMPLTITYRHAGTQPPIFVAGEFSDPPWEPQEMEYTTDEDGEHTFKKEIFAQAGSRVQYKFRVGTGDWWVLNEDAPTAMDSGGFLNNVAEVPPATEVSTPAAVADKAKKISNSSDSAADQKDGEPPSTEEGDTQARKGPSFVDAAKALRNRIDPESGTGTSTPDFVRTAAEVADSAALLDKDDMEDNEPTVANPLKRLMHRLDPHAGSEAGSGTSTPSFVRTAAEVADSAALLDKEDADSEVTDEEAGRTGFRRMSLTPIQDVAATAAEVADSARDLDSDPPPQLDVRPAEYDDMDPYNDTDPYGFDEPSVPDNKAPLFAHECVGMELYEGEDVRLPPDDDERRSAEYEGDRRPSTVYDDEDDIDLNDPTLVKFPSNRDEIIDTVRKLEGGLNEDHSDVEGLVPASPIVGPSGAQNHDLMGDIIVSSPAISSPVAVRGSGSRLLGPPRVSIGSISSDRSSALSLGSISEAEEAGDGYQPDPPPMLSAPVPRSRRSTDDPKSPTSEYDEGIAMRVGNDKNDKSREPLPDDNTPVRTPGGDSTPKTTGTETRTEDSRGPSRVPNGENLVSGSEASASQTSDPSDPPGQVNGQSRSPCLFAQPEAGLRETETRTEDTSADRSVISAATSENNAKPTGVDTGNQSQLRRRAAAPDRVGTPTSISEAGMQAAKSGSWFRSFFRMIFVDWIGGFISRLCGGRRETLFAAGAAGILVGVAWWRNTTK